MPNVQEVVEQADGYVLWFDRADGRLATIASFVELESRCCAFLDFEIRVESASDRIALVLSGPDGTKEFLKPLIEKRGRRQSDPRPLSSAGARADAPARRRDRRAEDLQDLVEEKDVGEQCPQMERGVEVVHQLGADPGLSQHQTHRRQRLAGIVSQHPLEVLVLSAGGNRFGGDEALERRRQPVERRGQAVELIADAAALAGAALGREALGGEGQHVLVSGLDGVEPAP